MKISICYTAVSKGPITANYCARFVGSYISFPGLAEHKLVVVCNGGELPTAIKLIFDPVGAEFLPRTNDQGFDISGYIEAAKTIASDSDAMLCLGESVYFHREGWLERLVQAWKKYGTGIYGPFASHSVRAHLNTTAFMCSPKELVSYPVKEWTRSMRYEFEHGTNSIWRLIRSKGMPAMLVTWDGEWPPGKWREPKDVLWKGTQRNLLMYCNHSERWHNAPNHTKQSWSKNANQQFK